jgi:hypothetical protein
MSHTTCVSPVSDSRWSPRWPRQTRSVKSSTAFCISPVSACPAASGLRFGLQNRFLTCGFLRFHGREHARSGLSVHPVTSATRTWSGPEPAILQTITSRCRVVILTWPNDVAQVPRPGTVPAHIPHGRKARPRRPVIDHLVRRSVLCACPASAPESAPSGQGPLGILRGPSEPGDVLPVYETTVREPAPASRCRFSHLGDALKT